MQQRGFRSVFVKLFVSVMLALTLFAVAMVLLTQLVHDKDATIRSQVLATQILSQVEPFLVDLNEASNQNNRLQARFMLAVIKKSFDIFDESLQAKMGLYDQEGHLLMQTDNSDLPQILPERPSWASRVFPVMADAPTQQVQVSSATGYILLFESRLPPKKPVLSSALNLFTGTLLLLCIMAGVLWWIARSMTWRINQLSQQMTQLGDGDFSARVTVRGNDEIAALAKGFNQAAQKIEQLINANNLLLAHASHELRTPITRIRLQIEMMDMLAATELKPETKAKFDKRAQAINRDLTGLNDLVESILLVSRLDAGHALQQVERLDLYTLVNQECQHYPEAVLFGEHIVIEGQPQLLTHLIRNLLNNAMLHGVPPVTVMLYGVETIEQATEIPEPLIQSLLTHNIEFDDEIALIESGNYDEITEIDHEFQADSAIDIDSSGIAADVATNHLDSSPSDGNLITDLEAAANAETTNSDHELQVAVVPIANHDKTSEAAESEAPEEIIPPLTDNQSAQANDDSLAQGQQDKADTPDDQLDNVSNNESAEDSQPAMSAIKESLFKKRLRKPKTNELRPQPNFAVLAVIDEGHGIPIDKREDIFSPFVRLQQKKKGSGLGLSLVAQIVTAHQGRISTDTVNGHTRFLVILPVDMTRSALVDADKELPPRHQHPNRVNPT